MKEIRITKEFNFEMSHALEGYDGACSQIHGHSYKLFVTVKGYPAEESASPKFGMVMDFGQLKKIVNTLIIDKFDHSFVIRKTDRNSSFVESLTANFNRVIITDFQPTCENTILHFAEKLAPELPANVRLFSLRLHETATSFAEWYADDN